jgi:hypothetical protein
MNTNQLLEKTKNKKEIFFKNTRVHKYSIKPSFSQIFLLFIFCVFLNNSNAQLINSMSIINQGHLDSSDSKGYLKLLAPQEPDLIYVVVNGNYKNYFKVNHGDSILLPIGKLELIIACKGRLDKKIKVDITEGYTTIYKVPKNNSSYSLNSLNGSYLYFQYSGNLFIYTDDDSEILINAKNYGKGTSIYNLPEGRYHIKTIHPLSGSSEAFVYLFEHRLKILEMWNKPRKYTAKLLSIFPGFSQYYKNEKIKGSLFLGVTTAALGLAYNYHQSFEKKNKRYLDTLNKYRQANTEADALKLGDEAQAKYDEAKNEAENRDLFLYVASVIYIVNLIDGLNEPSSGYRDENASETKVKVGSFLELI